MRVHNFSAGPGALPLEVLSRAQAELLDYDGCGMSVMEMSHRSDTFIGIAARAEANCRTLLGISDDYAVLFLQGGATAQFAAVPQNLLPNGGKADYVNTGAWSTKAIKEAARYVDVAEVASSKASNFDRIPDVADWALRPDADYLHLCSNETIGGVQFHEFPASAVPLVVDMSSDLMSRPVDVNRFALIYAGAQKNLGPAGLTLVIVRRDLLDRGLGQVPAVLHYGTQAAADSMSNTPPTYAWYLVGLVFEWLLAQGGLPAMAERNRAKAERLYGVIEASNFYRSPVAPAARSWMNVPFTLPDPALDAKFLAGAEAAGLMNLKGHRSVGGMRASIYNALDLASVEALCDYMASFEREQG